MTWLWCGNGAGQNLDEKHIEWHRQWAAVVWIQKSTLKSCLVPWRGHGIDQEKVWKLQCEILTASFWPGFLHSCSIWPIEVSNQTLIGPTQLCNHFWQFNLHFPSFWLSLTRSHFLKKGFSCDHSCNCPVGQCFSPWHCSSHEWRVSIWCEDVWWFHCLRSSPQPIVQPIVRLGTTLLFDIRCIIFVPTTLANSLLLVQLLAMSNYTFHGDTLPFPSFREPNVSVNYQIRSSEPSLFIQLPVFPSMCAQTIVCEQ